MTVGRQPVLVVGHFVGLVDPCNYGIRSPYVNARWADIVVDAQTKS